MSVDNGDYEDGIAHSTELYDYAIAVIGSSGGGTATLGHTDVPALLDIIDGELELIHYNNESPSVSAAATTTTFYNGSSSSNNNSNRGTVGLSKGIFVALDSGKGFDHVDETVDVATLYEITTAAPTIDKQPTNMDDHSSDSRICCNILKKGVVKDVNAYVHKNENQIDYDHDLAEAIRSKRIHGLICISCDTDLFEQTLKEAAKLQIPVVGTGGTSLSLAVSKYGINLIGNSGGSVATTSVTKAISFTYALANHWNLFYRPWVIQSSPNATTATVRPSWTSVLNSCLPAFWGVCLTKKICSLLVIVFMDADIVTQRAFKDILNALSHQVLPATCAVIMATTTTTTIIANDDGTTSSSSSSITGANTNVIIAAILASSLCSQSILGGLLVGYILSTVANTDRLVFWCVVYNIPATATNLFTSGGIGGCIVIAAGVLCVLFLKVYNVLGFLKDVTGIIRWIIYQSISLDYFFNDAPSELRALKLLLRATTGFIYGCFCCYGSKVGLYHSFILPLILIEMEHGNASFLGAVDELTLVLTCAGICSANYLIHTFSSSSTTSLSSSSSTTTTTTTSSLNERHQQTALCKRAIYINLCHGDFIEACYPYMEQYPIINLGGYLGSGLSVCVMLLLCTDFNRPYDPIVIPVSSAYVPYPVSVFLLQDGPRRIAFIVASAIAFGVPFLATIINHNVGGRWRTATTKDKGTVKKSH